MIPKGFCPENGVKVFAIMEIQSLLITCTQGFRPSEEKVRFLVLEPSGPAARFPSGMGGSIHHNPDYGGSGYACWFACGCAGPGVGGTAGGVLVGYVVGVRRVTACPQHRGRVRGAAYPRRPGPGARRRPGPGG